MLRNLDLNLCKDGYQVENINCLDLPIAAAARFFKDDFFQFYCIYFAFFLNWTRKDPNQWTMREEVLNKFGLTLKAYPVRNRSQLIKTVKYHIDQNHPLIMLVKYNSLFYYPEYMNISYNVDHGLIISGYDAKRSLIEIRDCTIARKYIKPEIKADILLPMQLTMEMVWSFWDNSNQSFKKEKSLFANRIFAIEKVSEPKISGVQELITDLLSYGFSFSKLENQIVDFNVQLNEKTLRNDFYNSLKMFFGGLEITLAPLFQKNEQWRNRFLDFQKEFMEYRDLIVTKIFALLLRQKAFQEDEKKVVIEKIRALENRLFVMMEELSDAFQRSMSTSQGMEYVYLDLAKQFNNQGFGKDLPEKSAACFSLKGSYLLLPADLPPNLNWEIHDLKFSFPRLGEGLKDNIVCDGQIITVPQGCYSTIMLLGCAEQEYITENIILRYLNGRSETVTIQFSNFDNLPVFPGELVAWKGPWLKKIRGEFRKTYSAYLFARKHLLVSENEITQIILPVCRNIHLFAITLGRSVIL